MGKLVKKALSCLSEMRSYGTSRNQDKKLGITSGRIYSYGTYKTYENCLRRAFSYIEEKHPDAKTFKAAKPYLQEYINTQRSAWSQSTYAAAFAKLYHCSIGELELELKERYRADIEHSRYPAARDAHFSEANNAELVAFCQHTGLRRREIETIKGGKLHQDDSGQWYISGVKGKGGKVRDVPILGNYQPVIDRMRNTPSDRRVWGKVSTAADIHSYRSEYATTLYNSLAREVIPDNDKYICRSDKVGIVYDKQAMAVVSCALGHNRIDVIASSYLR